MAKKLVIVESPAKAKTIEKFLGRDFHVMASMGHIVDLPKKGLGVNTRKDFAPKYEVIEKKDKLIDELKAASLRADEVFLAPDPDREGEFIAWSLQNVLGLQNPRRAVFHEKPQKGVSGPYLKHYCWTKAIPYPYGCRWLPDAPVCLAEPHLFPTKLARVTFLNWIRA